MKATEAVDLVMVAARVPPALAREIKLYALRREISLQQVIREALERQLAKSVKATR